MLINANSLLNFDRAEEVATVTTGLNNVYAESFWSHPKSTRQSILLLNSASSVSVTSGVVSGAGFSSPTIYVNGNLNGTVTVNTWNDIVVTTVI